MDWPPLGTTGQLVADPRSVAHHVEATSCDPCHCILAAAGSKDNTCRIWKALTAQSQPGMSGGGARPTTAFSYND